MTIVPLAKPDVPQPAKRPLIALTGVQDQGDGRFTLQITVDSEAVWALFRLAEQGGGAKGPAKPSRPRARKPAGDRRAEPRVKQPSRKKPSTLPAWLHALLSN
ncbi:MAG TPA: hypothetical protein VG826_29320 [Pirellulales bacterium]|nr:hypothetical protein [Pirellulales bacterium]